MNSDQITEKKQRGFARNHIADPSGNIIPFQGSDGVDVVPNDDFYFPNAGNLFVGNGGTLKVDLDSGATLTFQNISDGAFLPILVRKVYATTTNCTNIILLF